MITPADTGDPLIVRRRLRMDGRPTILIVGIEMWYAHGAIVLDRVLGVARAKRVSIFFDDHLEVPSREELIEVLRLPTTSSFTLSNTGPILSFDFERFAIAESGRLIDLAADGLECRPPSLLSAAPLTYRLSVEAIVNLWCLQSAYPELHVDNVLYRRLLADMRHFVALSRAFPEIELLLSSFGVYSDPELEVPKLLTDEGLCAL